MKVMFFLMALLMFVPPLYVKVKKMKQASDYKQWRKYQDANHRK